MWYNWAVRLSKLKKGSFLIPFVAFTCYLAYWLVLYLIPIVILSKLGSRSSGVVSTFRAIFSDSGFVFSVLRDLGQFYFETFFGLEKLTLNYGWLSFFYFFIIAPILIIVPYLLIKKFIPTFSKFANLALCFIFLVFSIIFIFTNILTGLTSRLPVF